jgi:ubiquinone/menaquinone biosynthesis C-methylase UbiE
VARPVRHPLFARVYTRLRPAMDRQGAMAHRRRLLAGLSGRVLEVGAGDGGNFAFYPPEVTGVVAVEPEPYLRSQAARRATVAPVPVEVVDGLADRLPVGDGAVDAAVVSLVLCSVPDQAAALAELCRALRPGGELRFYEHVAAETPGLARAQAVADRTLWPLLCGGCHTGRDTVAAIGAAGFAVEEVDRFRFPPNGPPTPATPHALGRARRA